MCSDVSLLRLKAMEGLTARLSEIFAEIERKTDAKRIEVKKVTEFLLKNNNKKYTRN